MNFFCLLSDADLLELMESRGKYAPFLSDMCKFYRDWHVNSDGVYGNFTYPFDAQCHPFLRSMPLVYSLIMICSMLSGIFLYDPVTFVALVRPDLFTYKKGVMRVETQGICVGHPIMDLGLKKYDQI